MSRTADRRRSQHHALVLTAIGIESGSMVVDGEWIVLARMADADRARAEIARHDEENRGWPPRETHPVPVSQGLYAALAYATILGTMFLWQKEHRFDVDWLRVGRAEAARITSGEWWLSITALSLHADAVHVLGNVVFGAAFGVVLAQSVGVGLAWIAFFVSGALGNYANAWIQPGEHASIGASTAVFGALGAQVAYEWMKRKDLASAPWRRWAPVIGGLALLGWLGAGGSFQEGASTRDNVRTLEQTLSTVDVMAHATGFLSGAAIGALLGLRKKRWRLSLAWQIALTLAPLAGLAGAWALALRAK